MTKAIDLFIARNYTACLLCAFATALACATVLWLYIDSLGTPGWATTMLSSLAGGAIQFVLVYLIQDRFLAALNSVKSE